MNIIYSNPWRHFNYFQGLTELFENDYWDYWIRTKQKNITPRFMTETFGPTNWYYVKNRRAL